MSDFVSSIYKLVTINIEDMRIHDIHLKNIGPFKTVDLEFIGPFDDPKKPPVIIITGENGSGKTIIIDAIRTLFYGAFRTIERDIAADEDFLIQSRVTFGTDDITLVSKRKDEKNHFVTNDMDFNKIFTGTLKPLFVFKSVVNYWTSKLSQDSFQIKNIEAPNTSNFLQDALTGIHRNIEVTKLITFFDYLRDSKDKNEREIGEKIYSLISDIINLSISNGELSHVSRIDLKPIINIQKKNISLDKLSSGNLYLIQRFIYLLKQLYSISLNSNIPISKIQSIPGLLLIDEAENHLHPKWQKVFLKNLQEIFPNVQIILTTHSPFIVSSIENSRVFVCKSLDEFSIITEETDFYSNKPIEEILLSPLFDTSNFGEEITILLKERKEAIKNNNQSTIKRIEEQLLKMNPDYFNFLEIEKLINKIKK